jgi:Na+/citrate or Na+/malate symporter
MSLFYLVELSTCLLQVTFILFRAILPLRGPLLGLGQVLPGGDCDAFSVGNFVFLFLETLLKRCVLAFEDTTHASEFLKFFIASLVHKGSEHANLLSRAVEVVPMALL